MQESDYITFVCAACGEENETFVDRTAGMRQTYVEDCAVCCRPNVLRISVDEQNGRITLQAELEG